MKIYKYYRDDCLDSLLIKRKFLYFDGDYLFNEKSFLLNDLKEYGKESGCIKITNAPYNQYANHKFAYPHILDLKQTKFNFAKITDYSNQLPICR